LAKLVRLAPISTCAVEQVRFDMQQMQNSEIKGIEYQQGTLAGYEVREYLLEKWQRTCAYCGKKDIPLQIEHIVPRSGGGSCCVSNLTLACQSCNQSKGAQAQRPLKDAAAVNATRLAVVREIRAFGLPTVVGTGAQTKMHRQAQGYAKDHWTDAACVGEAGAAVFIPKALTPLLIKAVGRGHRQMGAQ
jgi:hypothetical protein